MMQAYSEAIVVMETPRRYMTQLCKHFEHKVPVTLEEDSGSISFPMGACLLRAEADRLVMRVAGEDLARLEDVVARHLQRFAFRAPPEIVWTRQPLKE
jgi:hypothetical protein